MLYRKSTFFAYKNAINLCFVQWHSSHMGKIILLSKSQISKMYQAEIEEVVESYLKKDRVVVVWK